MQISEQDDEQNCLSIVPLPMSNTDLQRLALGKEASQHAITTLIRSMGLLRIGCVSQIYHCVILSIADYSLALVDRM